MNRLYCKYVLILYASYVFYIFEILIAVDSPEHLLNYRGMYIFFILFTLLYFKEWCASYTITFIW